MKAYFAGAIAAAAIGLQVMLLVQAITHNFQTAQWAFWFGAVIGAIALFIVDDIYPQLASWVAMTVIITCIGALVLTWVSMSITLQAITSIQQTKFCWYASLFWLIAEAAMYTEMYPDTAATWRNSTTI